MLIITTVWPEPESSAAGSRMMQLISVFQDDGWRVTVSSASKEGEFSVDMEKLGISTIPIEINDSSFDTFIQKLQPDVVIFDRFIIEEQFGWRVAEHCPAAVRILDTEDLHCLRKGRQEAVKKEHIFDPDELLQSDTAKREMASILRCDLSLIISEFEMKLLRNLFNLDSGLLLYLPFLLSPIDETTTSNWPSFDQRSHFVTIGNFRHAPNMDAVQYLKQKIWPIIRKKLPNAEMHVYGAYPSAKALALNKPTERFYIKGRANDAIEVMSCARTCLAPLRFGAGLKGKLIQAMQCGTPSVTTDIGAEGLNGNLDWPGEITNSPNEFAEAAVTLYSNKSAWADAQKQGVEIINSRFQKKTFKPSLLNRISELRQNLTNHRTKNFTGTMLMHHTMASTKYMAKWIEGKNR